jgi:hypothetical protein
LECAAADAGGKLVWLPAGVSREEDCARLVRAAVKT